MEQRNRQSRLGLDHHLEHLQLLLGRGRRPESCKAISINMTAFELVNLNVIIYMTLLPLFNCYLTNR